LGQKVKGVAFNMNDEKERELYQHAMKQGKFSKYVKWLIECDIRGMLGRPPKDFTEESTNDTETA
jgi:hypothetical protein